MYQRCRLHCWLMGDTDAEDHPVAKTVSRNCVQLGIIDLLGTPAHSGKVLFGEY